MKTITTSFLILATSLVAQARLIPHWSDQELLDKSDLVVIATPTTRADTQERTDLPGLTAQQAIGVETGFAVSAVVKGDKTFENFVLHHYRADGGLSFRGPNFVAFKPEEKRKFLLFLKRESDGRYAPTVGQVDPGSQGITVLSEPVSAGSNASFSYESTDDYFISGSFVVDNPPADHTGLGVWQGTLKLPAMKIVVPKTIPSPLRSNSTDDQKAPIYLHLFTSGLGESRQHLKTLTTRIAIGQDFDVRVDDGLESISGRMETRDGKLVANFRSHYASCSYHYDGNIEMEKKYDAGNGSAIMSSILFVSNFVVSTNADNKPFLLIQAEPTATQKQFNSIPAAVQAVLNDLGIKCSDPTWSEEFDKIERPESCPPDYKVGGEVTAYLASTKKRLAELEVNVKWNREKKIYEVEPSAPVVPPVQAKDDPIARLTNEINDTHGMWFNGISPSLDLPPTASSDEVLLKIIARNRLGTNVRTLEIRKDWPIQAFDPKGNRFTAALVEVDVGKRIILFRKQGDTWWSRVCEVP